MRQLLLVNPQCFLNAFFFSLMQNKKVCETKQNFKCQDFQYVALESELLKDTFVIKLA